MYQNFRLRIAKPPLTRPMVCRDSCLSVREVARCSYYVDRKRIKQAVLDGNAYILIPIFYRNFLCSKDKCTA